MDSRTQRSFKDIQAKHLGRIFGIIVRVRAFAGPKLLLVLTGTALLDPAPWRLAWMGTVTVCALTFFYYELRRYNREGLTKRTVPFNIFVGVLFQQCLVVGTGGLASPLLPVVLPLAYMGATVLPWKHQLWVMATELLALTVMAMLQLLGWLPHLPLPFMGTPAQGLLIAVAVTMALLIILSNVMGIGIRNTFDDMLREALAQRDELLATHRTYSRVLESMSAEIAHELKNPLATVKGLTQLMVREAGRAQPTERLEVLSSEVVRMQGILEEFLNFSRPLVPLSVSEVDLTALCDEALVLHEGLAHERGVRLAREAESSIHARCDPRKVKQVLMNLLHNAIEASPRGGLVTLALESTSTGEVRVFVRDEGSGLPPEVAGRVFEAGVTTKAKGSGLGLTVARALARQHGGELTLANAPSRGCVAELLLPRELPADTLGPVHGREVAHG
ncbi:sensor histidine kinase [Pyxidicoccus xibeiensis]|uniref:sensor histidine kinase n=1 Tax=Pyxidicoccus xibeiensis TaxID=2906759 RepID=UPI0020A82F8A|nr:HAMP domain-containing sensor histidine kinase [Pyxidicoccus xibeiensis]MCP3142285.1 HAMP domain-containing histidine kinase [Pyxidicoccus xibeiensis]